MNSIKYIAIVLLLFTSCKKEKTEALHEGSYKNGILILNEGLFQHNNSNLSWLDLSTNEVTKDIFLSINNRPIGDTGNDMLLYGGKIYIAVTGSSTIEVLDKNSLKSLKQISFNHNNQSQEPRNLTHHNGKIFVSSFDGYVTAIDTSSLNITKRIKVGRNPEGICVSNNALYVANSGGLDVGNADTTVFKIDLLTLNVVDTFVVGENPGAMIADSYNNVYVVKRGDYASAPSELVRINTIDQSVVNLGILATSLAKRGDYLYLSHFDYNTNASTVSIFDCATQALINPNFISNQDLTTLYGIAPFKTNQLICIDAMSFTNSGYLRFFNSSGQLTNSFNVGLNPNSIIHYE
jgi:YVTN family beta-propeller protein